MKNDLVALIDLDGTVANSSCKLETLIHERIGNDLCFLSEEKKEEMRKNIMNEEGFWLNLPILEDGIELYFMIQSLGFNIYILTKGLHDSSTSWKEKFEWSKEKFPSCKVVISEDKSLVYGNVLIDDWPPNILTWKSRFPLGFVIMPVRIWNKDSEITAMPNVIRYDGENLNLIKEKIIEYFIELKSSKI